ncbi:hypothetical protein [Catenulispora pinisilvae]|uniref:hypothetical protein n=1 Tax=Catenulispora pinisilvae TaxID=2705253 RepID=UPI001891FB44|nr:hypothetical protein [Catenulispora pinisilvae]
MREAGPARPAHLRVLIPALKGSATSIEIIESASSWIATDGHRRYEINPGSSGFVVRDAATGEQIAAIWDLSEVEDL